jgi:acyl-CoA thioester hydrolase
MADPLEQYPLQDYPVRLPALTRWSDNDMYGHLNNAIYYELFDSAINTWLAESAGVSYAETDVIGVVAESGCRFHGELAFPQSLTVGLRISRLGRSSVVYRLGLFGGTSPAPDELPSATCRWVHVYIDRASRRSVEIPGKLRAAMQQAILDTPDRHECRDSRRAHP